MGLWLRDLISENPFFSLGTPLLPKVCTPGGFSSPLRTAQLPLQSSRAAHSFSYRETGIQRDDNLTGKFRKTWVSDPMVSPAATKSLSFCLTFPIRGQSSPSLPAQRPRCLSVLLSTEPHPPASSSRQPPSDPGLSFQLVNPLPSLTDTPPPDLSPSSSSGTAPHCPLGAPLHWGQLVRLCECLFPRRYANPLKRT